MKFVQDWLDLLIERWFRQLSAVFHMGWLENHVGKGENAGYQYFFHFSQYFPKPSVLLQGYWKSGCVGTG